MTSALSAAKAWELSTTVRSWWPDVARDLPWRASRDPWQVLVSEVMAQQTQVDRVIPKWTAFLERFPTVHDAAEASAGDLIQMWDGLGYNRRALLLHRCAGEVVHQHEGVFPDDLATLLTLPGIGPYTARAVLAFAFERDVAVVDTNVGRVLARVSGASLAAPEVQATADELVPDGAGWEWNQAVLDFGATVCSKRAPRCAECPVRPICAWAGNGPDPAVGSAAVSVRQSRFAGSDRQGRGRLIAALRNGPMPRSDALKTLGFGSDSARAERVFATLLRDEMIVSTDETVALP